MMIKAYNSPQFQKFPIDLNFAWLELLNVPNIQFDLSIIAKQARITLPYCYKKYIKLGKKLGKDVIYVLEISPLVKYP
ncbi:hypothetical protein IM40_08145 [Candidatus Paracaedimonas acanthamoebae]|nr:hypothetical protein IM40_08145 [Candidatus Paracaedimonas acanthamoebae]